MTGDPQAPARTGAKQWWGLATLVLPSTLLFMMLTILFLAAPSMAIDLEPTSTQLLWILDIYGFVMAGFLVAMGVVGDRVGKRLLMVIGAIGFGAISIAAAMTTDPGMMIAWRAVLGLFGAMMVPSTLGLIFVMFADAKARGIAIGVWAGGISAGVALGPLLSGILLESFGWQATFLVAVPVMVLVAIGAPLLLPEHRDPNARIDLFSAVLLVASLLAIIYGIKRFAAQEPAGPSIGLLIAGALVGLWFVIRQLRAERPLLDVRLFANRTVSAALIVFMLSAAALGGVYSLFTTYLQSVQGLSPLQAGFAILPAAVVLIVVSTLAPVFARRFRPGNVIAIGLATQVVGYGIFTQLDEGTGLALVIASFALTYPGVAPAMALTTDLVVGSVPPEKAGGASGLATTANDLGISLGVAIIGSIGVFAYRSRISELLPDGLPDEAAATAESGVDGALAVASELPAQLGDALVEAAQQAFSSGLNAAAVISAIIAALTAIIAATRLRHVQPTGK
ncbi:MULTISPECIES: MFS transporter [Brevibacterium]|uniref:MFS transporter n=3 Tax=Bacteria TaxID=2 RepID=A0A7T4A263_9MICO|nr:MULTISPECIES: MFS transporter [Brevibacterium]MCM1013493.1 MFS transporter [Brevibacterium sp. XM4083]MCT1446145.1 MFS transporter [Brevibacterium casei]MCT1765003.1 MFS transporter [Brevibacterium casei]MCT2182527.1 MFS transporter [Brevibacterium casei]MDH5149875.1 MFS transporter [Brevibacterium casei]